MQIGQVAIGNRLVALAPGQPVTVRPGQTVRVSYAFNYKVAETTSVEARASLYQRVAGVINRVEQAQKTQTITLEESLDWKPYEGQIDIMIGQQVKAGRYGLICEIPKYDVEAHLDDVIQVAGAMDLSGLIVLALLVGMVGMMTPMMREAM
jgi:hypothetical protein